jgi:hypothetical protein
MNVIKVGVIKIYVRRNAFNTFFRVHLLPPG